MNGVLFAILLLASPPLLVAQPTDASAANQKRARQILDATIQALGGPAWLNLWTIREQDRTAAFYQGNPTGLIVSTIEVTELPDKRRVEFGRKAKDVQIFVGRQAWEISYKGKKDLSKARVEDYLRWRDHSLGVALRQWYRDPATTLLYEGQTQVERHLADKIRLIGPANSAVTLEVDGEDHHPLRLSFAWRDPEFRDKNLDTVEYDNYQTVDGIATPDTVTWRHNGQTVRQRYVLHVAYNVALAKGEFDPDQAAARIK